MPDLSSLDLAKLIIKYADISNYEHNQVLQENQLITYIQENNVEELAYWLHFNSHIKHLIKKASQNGEILADKLNQILQKYLEDQIIKKTSPKYEELDFEFDNARDLENKISKLKTLSTPTTKIPIHNLDPLLKAKARRGRQLDRRFNPVAVVTDEYDKEEVSLKHYCDAIKNIKPGERKQLFYTLGYHAAGAHIFGTDVERDENGKLHIFAFESAGDPAALYAIDKLYSALESSHENYDLRACLGRIQYDKYNCSIYSIAALQEFAKYDHVFEYLPEIIEEDLDAKQIKTISVTEPPPRTYNYSHLEKVIWVQPHDLPTKIISMTQSNDELLHRLEASTSFDLNEQAFLERLNNRIQFNPDKPYEKYLNKRRQKMAEHFELKSQEIFSSIAAKEKDKYPFLQAMLAGTSINIREIVEKNSYTSDDIIDLFDTVLIALDISQNTSRFEIEKKISDSELIILNELQKIYLEKISQAYIQNKNLENLQAVGERLSSFLSKYYMVDVIKLINDRKTLSTQTTLMDRFEEIFNIPERLGLNTRLTGSIDSRVSIDPPIISVETIESRIAEIDQEYYYAYERKPYFSWQMKISLLNNLFKKIITNDENTSDYDLDNSEDLSDQQLMHLVAIRNVALKIFTRENLKNLDYYNFDLPIFSYPFRDEIAQRQHLACKLLSFHEIASNEDKISAYNKTDNTETFELSNPLLLHLRQHQMLRKQDVVNMINELKKIYSPSTKELTSKFTNRLRNFFEESFDYINTNKTISLQNKHTLLTALQDGFFGSDLPTYRPNRFMEYANQHYLDDLLGDAHINTTVDDILNKLNNCNADLLKLQLIEKAYDMVSNLKGNSFYHNEPNSSFLRAWISEYSPNQLKHIAILKKAYIKVLEQSLEKHLPTSYEARVIRDSIARNPSTSHPHLLDFNVTRFSPFKAEETTSRILVTKLMEAWKQNNTKQVQMRPIIPLNISDKDYQVKNQQNALNFGHNVKEYYKARNTTGYLAPAEDQGAWSFRHLIFGGPTSYYSSYQKKNLQNNTEDNWKFNLAIHFEDIEKALEIVGKWIYLYEIASFKVASQMVARNCFRRNDENWVGREVVIYTHYNPDMAADRWIEFIRNLEADLDKHNIRPSTDNAPASNRQLGKYTSYLHECINPNLDKFEDGLQKKQMEDIFKDYDYELPGQRLRFTS